MPRPGNSYLSFWMALPCLSSLGAWVCSLTSLTTYLSNLGELTFAEHADLDFAELLLEIPGGLGGVLRLEERVLVEQGEEDVVGEGREGHGLCGDEVGAELQVEVQGQQTVVLERGQVRLDLGQRAEVHLSKRGIDCF